MYIYISPVDVEPITNWRIEATVSPDYPNLTIVLHPAKMDRIKVARKQNS
jgi:hypothetical protein